MRDLIRRQFFARRRVANLQRETEDGRGGDPAAFVASIVARRLSPPLARVGKHGVQSPQFDRLFETVSLESENAGGVLDRLCLRQRILERGRRRRPAITATGETIPCQTLSNALASQTQSSRDFNLIFAVSKELDELDVVGMYFGSSHCQLSMVGRENTENSYSFSAGIASVRCVP